MSGAATISLPSEGRLAAHSLPWLLGTLDVVRATGALDVTRRKLVRRFVLEDGSVAAVVSNAREDRFFDWLLVKGHFAAAPTPLVEALGASLADAPLTAGAVLAARLLPPEEAILRLREHALEMLRESASWHDATFVVRPGTAPLGAEPRPGLRAAAAALVLAREEAAAAKRPLPLPRWIAARADAAALGEAGLDAAERSVLDAARRPVDPRDLGPRAGLDEAPLQAALGALWRAGLVAQAAPPTEAEVEETGEVTAEILDRWIAAANAEDFDAVLGVAPGAPPGEVRKAYYRTVRRFHPDRFREGPFSARHREIEQAFRLVHEALELLTNPAARAERDARLRRAAEGAKAAARTVAQTAAEQHQRALRALAQGRRAEALVALERATQLEPGNEEYAVHLALLLLGNPQRRREATEALAARAKAAPSRADLLALVALAHAKAGRDADADAARRRVLQLDPTQLVALALGGDPAALDEVRRDPLLGFLF